MNLCLKCSVVEITVVIRCQRSEFRAQVGTAVLTDFSNPSRGKSRRAFRRIHPLSEADLSWPAGLIPESKRPEAWKKESTKCDILQLGELPKNIHESTHRMLNGTRIGPCLSTHNPFPFARWTDSYAASDAQTILAESCDGRTHHNMVEKWHPLHTSQYIWIKSIFHNNLLRYPGDDIEVVNHIESRAPFLDHHITEYANSLPPSL
ncbi:hypothetical protein BO70DRAFT_381195 [Aspergillus heteromorphus CBS 117.55]|uniref:Asparagine synthetase domain-containing protein n=1 Tax=Aspergillus heteromorphus CBS 117.55 TaxID=1448321 RepID=A0A317VR72_9EURO|nr:uncharacterized protein BO70DRAFT_381195 [Aspergillus heteromorphus CBS 117.55]PWY75517.1 hypothetical protein BO70DRAFT_381195 [Aspergillus heteromorphus CBS 117.55]